MKRIKKYFIYAIFIAIIIVIIINLINNVREKQYDKVISFGSSILGCLLISYIDSLYQNKIKKLIKRIYLLQVLFIIVIYIMPFFICILISSYSNNFYISNIFNGLLFPSIYFSVTRFTRWLDEDYPDQISEDNNK
jgi:phosphoglycerol transferase MdoB-like AlkP superfamily enzyme